RGHTQPTNTATRMAAPGISKADTISVTILNAETPARLQSAPARKLKLSPKATAATKATVVRLASQRRQRKRSTSQATQDSPRATAAIQAARVIRAKNRVAQN